MTNRSIKKITAMIVLFTLVLVNNGVALAFTVPTPPTAPSVPTPPSTPDTPTAPTPPPAPQYGQDDQEQENNDQEPSNPQENEQNQQNQAEATPQPTPASQQNNPQTTDATGQGQADDQSGSSQVGDTSVQTGDSSTGATVTNQGNVNSADSQTGPETGSVSVVNSENGMGSENTGSVTVVDNSNTTQTNSATVNNQLHQSAVTGENQTNKNVGDSSITTGDANVSGTILNQINTNTAGLVISEFNVANDHTGDIVLDFEANCIYGCGSYGSTTVANDGNGAYSNNSGSVLTQTNDLLFQTNDATVENNMVLEADSGHNQANKNTGGDSNITTGNANVSANVVNMVNNNIEGQVYYGVVNIYGDLVGDIIFPEELMGTGGTQVANSGNGAYSTNTGSVTNVTEDATFQTNNASINNYIVVDGNTGDNEVSKNTDGNSTITTGETNVQAQVLNVANMNLASGDMWLVLVNQAGQWIGQILGAPSGTNFAASQGAGWSMDEHGQITVTNADNGAGSSNTGSVTNTSSDTTVQSNNAVINNTLDLTANTGGNQASKNTGGNSNITTGDANIIANLINFVNTNVSGGGRLFITTVNVFGSWIGDFVTPGSHQQETASNQQTNPPAIGGMVSEQTNQSTQNTNNVGQNITATTKSNSNSGNNQANSQSGAITPTINQGVGELVAGIFDEAEPSVLHEYASAPADGSPAKKVVELNLAWLLGLIPASAVYLLARKFWFVA